VYRRHARRGSDVQSMTLGKRRKGMRDCCGDQRWFWPRSYTSQVSQPDCVNRGEVESSLRLHHLPANRVQREPSGGKTGVLAMCDDQNRPSGRSSACFVFLQISMTKTTGSHTHCAYNHLSQDHHGLLGPSSMKLRPPVGWACAVGVSLSAPPRSIEVWSGTYQTRDPGSS